MSHNAALAFIMAQHAAEQTAFLPPVVVTRQAKVTEVVQPAPVKLGPWEFLTAIRNAGKRKNQDGKAYTDPSKVREDSIAAIHAYCGYDSTVLFGQQESAARTKAQRELGIGKPNPNAKTLHEERAHNRTLPGSVHGNPDHEGKGIEDLLARERLAAAEMVRHQKESADMARSQADRDISAGMVAFEEDRLMHIRADLTRIGVIRGNQQAEGK
jgi:hypothetical protein